MVEFESLRNVLLMPENNKQKASDLPRVERREVAADQTFPTMRARHVPRSKIANDVVSCLISPRGVAAYSSWKEFRHPVFLLVFFIYRGRIVYIYQYTVSPLSSF